MQIRQSWSKYSAHHLIKVAVALISLGFIQGCASYSQTTTGSRDHQDLKASQPPHLARLFILRPREALLTWGDSNPVHIYQESKKIADIPHGRYVKLESPKLPKHLTLHWFDDQNPKISRTIHLKINLKPGETETVQLKMQDKNLLVTLITQDEASNQLAWTREHQISEDMSQSIAQRRK